MTELATFPVKKNIRRDSAVVQITTEMLEIAAFEAFEIQYPRANLKQPQGSAELLFPIGSEQHSFDILMP